MNKKILYAALGAVLIAVLFFTIRQFLPFHLVKTVPKNNSEPNQYTAIIYKFNRDLSGSKNGANKLTVEPSVPGKVSVAGKNVEFIPYSSYQVGVEYTATLASVLSAKGDKLPDIQIKFTPKYVAYNKLPEDIRQRLVKQTDSDDTGALPYTANVIAIDGSDELIEHGVTIQQLDNLKLAFFKFFQAKNVEVSGVKLADIVKVPHDRDSASTVDTINFSAEYAKSSYRAKMEYSNLTTIRLYLYSRDSGSLIYDSRSVGG